MCGFAGIVDLERSTTADVLQGTAERMADALVHRGPDDAGTWVDAAVGVALGFRRLSILDLSDAGHQPICSGDGRFVMVFNGEIYNHRALRAELVAQGCRFRGHSDSEVLVEAIARWGLEVTLRRSNGMFAIVVWDRVEGSLSLARDRFGEKPLYLHRGGTQVLFGSELKALTRVPGLSLEVDRSALASYFRWGYVAEPRSVYAGIEKVPAGAVLVLDASGRWVLKRYWSAVESMARLAGSADLAPDDAVDALDELLIDAVDLRREADVPLGAFLSGGIDSSLVVAMLQELSSDPVQTFTVGFTERAYDESAFAREVASHLGTNHHELIVTPEQAREVIPAIPSLYDEPFADSSALPTVLVSQLARRHVTVALSGDGGDELFGGYDRYFWALDVWRKVSAVPVALRAPAAAALAAVPPTWWDAALRTLPAPLRARLPASFGGHQVQRVASSAGAMSPDAVYRDLISHWKSPDQLVLDAREAMTPYDHMGTWSPLLDFPERMMLADSITYLPGDILTKLDRASMSVGLEARVPILDHRVAELAWSLPIETKVDGQRGKLPLRQLLARRLPSRLIERPKMGFGVPLGSWLRGPLREWAEDLLDSSRLEREGFLDGGQVRAMWDVHLRGERDAMFYLWDVLVFEAWLDHTKS